MKDGPRNKHRHIPQVLIEKILLNLPIKSLFRFSVVSKSWHSIIFAPEFAKSYRGQEMIVLRAYSDSGDKAVVCPLSSLSSDNPMDRATPFIRPFQANSYLDASCGQLWCVEFENSLLLYNPSIQSYRKLPVPSARVPIGSTVGGSSTSVFVYGLGYDSVSDDYKIVKIHRNDYVETELYSLRSDSWKKVELRFSNHTFLSSKGVFVSGAVHWLVNRCELVDPLQPVDDIDNYVTKRFILSFDLTTEQFGMLNLPKLPRERRRGMDITTFGGKLCVYLHNQCHSRFAAWVLEDYGSRSWAKEFQIDYANNHPLCHAYLKPLCFYDNSGNLIKAVTSSADMRNIFVYKEGSSILEEKSFGRYGCGMFDTYVDSFVSPWPPGERTRRNHSHDIAMEEAWLHHCKKRILGKERILGEERALGHGKERVSVAIEREEDERKDEGAVEHGQRRISVIDNVESSKVNHDLDIALEEVGSHDEVYNGHDKALAIIDNGDSSKGNHGLDIAQKEVWFNDEVYSRESSDEKNNGHDKALGHGQERVLVLEKGESSNKRSNGHDKSSNTKKRRELYEKPCP